MMMGRFWTFFGFFNCQIRITDLNENIILHQNWSSTERDNLINIFGQYLTSEAFLMVAR
jgi:hypothetical protein